MGKRKVGSTSKALNLQASKAARSKKDGRNQTKKGKTPVHDTKAKLSDQRKLQFSPDLSSILKNSESQEDDEQNDFSDNPLHSTAVFPGDLELNDKNEKEDEYLARSNRHKKPVQQPAPRGEKGRTKKGPGALVRISEGVEETERGTDTDGSSEGSSESIVEPAKKSEHERKTVKKASSSRAGKASKLSKDVPSRTSAGKIPSDGSPGIQQRADSAGARKRSLGNTRASLSTLKQRKVQQEGSSSDSSSEPLLPQPCTSEHERKTAKKASSSRAGKASKLSKDVPSRTSAGKIPSDGSPGIQQRADSAGARKRSLGNTRASLSTLKQRKVQQEGSSSDSSSEPLLPQPCTSEHERKTAKKASSSRAGKASKLSKDVPSRTSAGKIPSDGSPGIQQRADSAGARKRSLGNTRASLSTLKQRKVQQEGSSSDSSSEPLLPQPCTSEHERKTAKKASSSRAGKASKLSKDVPSRTSAGKIPSDGSPGIQQRADSAGARKRSLGNTRASLSTLKQRKVQQEGSSSDSSSEPLLPQPCTSEHERKTAKKASSSRAGKASKLSKDVPSRTSAGKIPSDGSPGIQQRADSAGARKRSLGNTRTSLSTLKQRKVQQEGSPSDSSSEPLLPQPCTEISSRNKGETSGKKKKKALVRTSSGSDASPVPSTLRPASPEDGSLTMKIWCPEGTKRTSKDITELDVVLNEFEQIVQEYQESMDSVICQKVVKKFFINFKEQVIETIKKVQDLKNMERRNTKVTATFNKTRKHFLIAQKELNEQEGELKRLQKEHSELSQKKADLQHVKQFLSGFKQMQTQYIEHRNKNPSEEETYDISSFPALLLEARGILGAEKQLRIINTKLEESLAKK
ncbi:uncharacterized protein cenpu [Rhinoraja longicauda]